MSKKASPKKNEAADKSDEQTSGESSETKKQEASATKTVKIKIFSLVREVKENEKCAPQAKVILAAVKELGEKKVEREKIIELLRDGRLTTRQTPERIFGYYRPILISAGILAEEVVEKEVPADKASNDKEGASESKQSVTAKK